jgi:hypothetical protein
VAFAHDRIGFRIDGAEHAEIHEAVVERRDQRIRHGMGEAGEVVVDAGCVDNNEIVGLLDHGQDIDKPGKLDGLVLVEFLGRAAWHAVMFRQEKRETGPFRPGAAVLNVAGETLLPQVEIDRGDALPEIQQSDRDVHGEGGLPRASLLVAKHDDVRGGLRPATRLHQHDYP